MELFQILCNDILPLLFFISAGYAIDAKFNLDLNTFNKLLIWIVLPSFIFYGMLQYSPAPTAVFLIPATALQLFLLFGISGMTARLFHVSPSLRTTFRAVSTYSNAGNIGLALIVFIYSHAPYLEGDATPYLDDARGTVILLLILMNIAVHLFGACQLRTDAVSVSAFFRYLFRLPALYAILAALCVQFSGLSLEHTFLWPVLHHFSGAFIVLVTTVVGAQLHRSRFRRPDKLTLLAVFLKLILSPLLAMLIIAAAGCFSPVEAQVFFIVSSIPTSFSIAMYAVEYNNHSDFAAEAVLVSTVLGLFTLTAAIYAAGVLYPV